MSATAVPSKRPAELEGTEWVLSLIRGERPLADITTNLGFSTVTNIYGHIGCWRYAGIYTSTEDYWLSMRPGVYDDPGCPRTGDIDEHVTAYIRTLYEAASYKATHGRLELRDVSGRTILVFTRNESPPIDPRLKGPTWVLVSLNGRPVRYGGADLDFNTDDYGGFGGSSGCNSYFGRASKANNGALKLGSAGGTEMACLAEGVMEQEEEYLRTLKDAASYRLAGDRLLIRDNRDRTILMFSRYHSELERSLVYSEWRLVSLHGEEPLEGAEITLHFTMTWMIGSTGCNGYIWELRAVKTGRFVLSDEDVLTTAAVCPKDLANQERRYLSALKGVASYHLADGHLQLRNGSGQTTLVFRKR